MLPASLQGAQGILFYELVLEFAAIEAKVLLVDAMRPAVPLAGDDILRKPHEGTPCEHSMIHGAIRSCLLGGWHSVVAICALIPWHTSM